MSEEAAATEAAPAANPGADAGGAAEGNNAPVSGGTPTSDQAAEAAIAEANAGGDVDLGRMVTVKVDGEERTIPLSEAVKNYELSRASHKRFQEAAQKAKSLEQKEAELRRFVEGLRDPGTLLRAAQELGMTPKQLQEAIEAEAQVSPQERKERELAERERRIREWEQQQRQEQQRRQLSAAAAREQERFSREFNQALEPHGLAGHPDMIAKMAEVMSTALDAGYQLTAAEAAELALEDLQRTTTGALSKMDVKTLRKQLGDDMVKALAKELAGDVKRTHEPRPNPRPGNVPSSGQPKRKFRVGELPDDFFDRR